MAEQSECRNGCGSESVDPTAVPHRCVPCPTQSSVTRYRRSWSAERQPPMTRWDDASACTPGDRRHAGSFLETQLVTRTSRKSRPGRPLSLHNASARWSEWNCRVRSVCSRLPATKATTPLTIEVRDRSSVDDEWNDIGPRGDVLAGVRGFKHSNPDLLHLQRYWWRGTSSRIFRCSAAVFADRRWHWSGARPGARLAWCHASGRGCSMVRRA